MRNFSFFCVNRRCSGRVVNFETARYVVTFIKKSVSLEMKLKLRSYAECGHHCEVHNLENAKEERGGGNFTARGDCEWFSHHQGGETFSFALCGKDSILVYIFSGECRLFSSCPRVVTPVEGWTTGEAVCVEEEHK